MSPFLFPYEISYHPAGQGREDRHHHPTPPRFARAQVRRISGRLPGVHGEFPGRRELRQFRLGLFQRRLQLGH